MTGRLGWVGEWVEVLRAIAPVPPTSPRGPAPEGHVGHPLSRPAFVRDLCPALLDPRHLHPRDVAGPLTPGNKKEISRISR